MQKSIKKTIIGLMASSMILSHVSMLNVTADEVTSKKVEDSQEINSIDNSLEVQESLMYSGIDNNSLEMDEVYQSEGYSDDFTDTTYYPEDNSDESQAEQIEALGEIRVSTQSNFIEKNRAVKIDVEVEHFENIDYIQLAFESESGRVFFIYLDQAKQSGRFEGELYYSVPRMNVNHDRIFSVHSMLIETRDNQIIELDTSQFSTENTLIELINQDTFENEITLDTDSIKWIESDLARYGIYELSLKVDSKLDDLSVWGNFQGDYSWYRFNLYQVEGTNEYRGHVNLSGVSLDATDSSLSLDYLNIWDEYGNQVFYNGHSNREEFNHLDIRPDIQQSFKVETAKSTIEVGETLEVLVRSEQKLKGVESLQVEYQSESERFRSVFLEYDDARQAYVGEFTYDTFRFYINKDRQFNVKSLYLNMESGAGFRINQEQIIADEAVISLVNADRTESSADIDLSSLAVSAADIQGYGMSTLSLNIKSDLDISDVRVTYSTQYGKEYSYWLQPEEGSDLYSRNLNLSNLESDRDSLFFNLKSIEVIDVYGNRTVLDRLDFEEEFSAGDIEVAPLGQVTVHTPVTEVKPDQTVEIFVDFPVVEGVDRIELRYRSNSGKSTTERLTYDEDLKRYVGEFHYNSSWFYYNQDRSFELEELVVITKERSRYYIDAEDLNTDRSRIELVDKAFYYGKPQVDLNTMTLSANEISNDNRALVSIQIESEVNLKESKLIYVDQFGKEETIRLSQFKQSSHYSGIIRPSYYSEIEEVHLIPDRLELRDYYGNFTVIRFNESESDFSDIKITVLYDLFKFSDTSVLLTDTFKQSADTGSKGDTIHYSVKLQNDEHVEEFILVLYHRDLYLTQTIAFSYEEDSGEYTASVEIDDLWFDGKWALEDFYTHSKRHRYLYVEMDKDDVFDYIQPILTIQNNRSIPNKPVVKVNDLTVSAKELFNGDTLVIAADLDIEYDATIHAVYASYRVSSKNQFMPDDYEDYNEYDDAYYDEYYEDDFAYDYFSTVFRLHLNEESGLYEATETINVWSDMDYQFVSLSVSGDFNQYTVAEIEDSIKKQADFTVLDNGQEPQQRIFPEIDFSNAVFSNDILTKGQTISLSLPVSHKDLIEYIRMDYDNIHTYEEHSFYFEYNPETEQFETVIDTDLILEGIHEATFIMIKGYENHVMSTYSRYHFYEDGNPLELMDFLVLANTSRDQETAPQPAMPEDETSEEPNENEESQSNPDQEANDPDSDDLTEEEEADPSDTEDQAGENGEEPLEPTDPSEDSNDPDSGEPVAPSEPEEETSEDPEPSEPVDEDLIDPNDEDSESENEEPVEPIDDDDPSDDTSEGAEESSDTGTDPADDNGEQPADSTDPTEEENSSEHSDPELDEPVENPIDPNDGDTGSENGEPSEPDENSEPISDIPGDSESDSGNQTDPADEPVEEDSQTNDNEEELADSTNSSEENSGSETDESTDEPAIDDAEATEPSDEEGSDTGSEVPVDEAPVGEDNDNPVNTDEPEEGSVSPSDPISVEEEPETDSVNSDETDRGRIEPVPESTDEPVQPHNPANTEEPNENSSDKLETDSQRGGAIQESNENQNGASFISTRELVESRTEHQTFLREDASERSRSPLSSAQSVTSTKKESDTLYSLNEGERVDVFKQTANSSDAEETLPQTATGIWTIGLASLVSLLGGAGIKLAVKKKKQK